VRWQRCNALKTTTGRGLPDIQVSNT
jgi:hypothetical protein